MLTNKGQDREKEKHGCFVPITSVLVEVTFSSGS